MKECRGRHTRRTRHTRRSLSGAPRGMVDTKLAVVELVWRVVAGGQKDHVPISAEEGLHTAAAAAPTACFATSIAEVEIRWGATSAAKLRGTSEPEPRAPAACG